MDLNKMKGEECVIMGTLYKHQELKPSILQEVSKQVRAMKKIKRISNLVLLRFNFSFYL